MGRTIKISACQFKLERIPNFDAFCCQVHSLMSQVPMDSDYVLFPELFTVGLLTTFPGSEQFGDSDMYRLDAFTEKYKELFSQLAKTRKQVIVAGSHFERQGEEYFNIGYIFDENGSAFQHKKTHLFPSESLFPASEGNKLEVFEIGPAKIGMAICYEAEIPEISRVLAVAGAEIIFCPSYTFSEAGFWRVRHCAHARAIENQVYFVHCPTVGNPGSPVHAGYGRAAILSPCDSPWSPNGIVVEALDTGNAVITSEVDIDELYRNRDSGAATTFFDRFRRQDVYTKYAPYSEF
jgi:predicted amidohydrolase